jgi:hypothetical protein
MSDFWTLFNNVHLPTVQDVFNAAGKSEVRDQNGNVQTANKDELAAFKEELAAQVAANPQNGYLKSELDLTKGLVENFDNINQYGAEQLGGNGNDQSISVNESERYNLHTALTQPIPAPAPA